jgi:hypothetical protein
MHTMEFSFSRKLRDRQLQLSSIDKDRPLHMRDYLLNGLRLCGRRYGTERQKRDGERWNTNSLHIRRPVLLLMPRLGVKYGRTLAD